MCHIRHLIQADPADRLELILLVEACIRHFRNFRGAAAGVANGSSGAAIRTGVGPQDFAFGSSQDFQLVPHAEARRPDPRSHAERVAWEAALHRKSGMGRLGRLGQHLYVELAPCAGDDGCAAWMHKHLPEDMNVWFLYDNPDLMRLAHREGLDMELATLHALWPPHPHWH